MQSIDVIETYAYETRKDLTWNKEKNNRDTTIGQ